MISERKGRRLLVLDFDDTLADTDSKILIRRANGEVVRMDTGAYATFTPRPGDKMDFSEFDRLIDPKPIRRNVRLLQRAVERKAADKIVILTARGRPEPVAEFLRMVGITSGVSIMAVGSSDPQKKANYIERQIQDGYESIAFIDDSRKNLKAVATLQQRYPNAKIIVRKAEGYGDILSPEEQDPSQPEERQTQMRWLERQIDTQYVMNPQTKRKIKLRSALNRRTYDDTHPVRQAALALLKQLRAQQPQKK